jgi:hypothetical protein
VIKEKLYYDDQNDKLTVERIQDVEPILEANRADFNAAPEKFSGRYDKPMVHVARIPLIVVEQWMKEGINVFDPSQEMTKKIRQRLNSPEYAYLRTMPGKI